MAGDQPARKRCEQQARQGTGTGTCNRVLDRRGNCDRAAQHTDQ